MVPFLDLPVCFVALSFHRRHKSANGPPGCRGITFPAPPGLNGKIERVTMKKILLGSTALVAATALSAGMTTAAKAELSVTGWSYQAFGIAVDPDKSTNQHDGFVTYQNSEMVFKGSTTLENGMEVSMKMELNAANGEGRAHTTAGKNEVIDETRFSISDDWGTVMLGSDDGASDSMHVGCAWIAGGKGVCSGVYSQFASGAVYGGAFMTTSGTMWSDPNQITYYTPVMNGFRAGLTYAPINESSAATAPAWSYSGNTEMMNNFSLGLEYNGDFDGVSLALSAGADHVNNPNNVGGEDDYQMYRAGADIGVGGFGLNLSYATQDYKTSATAQKDEWTFEAVGSYSVGASTFGLGYGYGERKNTIGGATTEGRILEADYSYSFGGGLYWDATLADIDYDDGVAGTTSSDADAVVFQTGVGVSF